MRQIEMLKAERTKGNMNDTTMKKNVAKKLNRKGIPSMIDRQTMFGYDENGVKVPSMFWKHKEDRRVKSKDPPDLQNRVNGFYRNMRGGDMSYIVTQTKNPQVMLWSTSPTRRLFRGESKKKDIAMQEKSTKKSKIFTGYIDDS